MKGKIAIVGGPGSGKSTLTAGLFRALKLQGVAVEVVPELIKYKVYQGSDFTRPGFDISNTLEQQHLEDIFTRCLDSGKLQVALCEAPLCNGYMYASYYGKDAEIAVLKQIADLAMPTYSAVVLVHGSHHEYQTLGRKEDRHQADEVHNHIIRRLEAWGIKYIQVKATDSIAEVIGLLNGS